MIYAPGMGGSAAQAKPYLDKFFQFIEHKLGWPEKSGTAAFLDDEKSVREYIEKNKPAFALVPPSFYLDLACKKEAVTPLVGVVLANATGVMKFHVVVKKGGAKSLDALKGKKLASNHLEDLRFVSNVVFEGKLDAEKHFELVRTGSPVKPFKMVDKGEADAALIADDQLAHMKTLPFGQNLEVVYSSPALPQAPVIAFDNTVKPAEREQLKKTLLEMCSSKEGAETCKAMTVSRFVPVDQKANASAREKYCK